MVHFSYLIGGWYPLAGRRTSYSGVRDFYKQEITVMIDTLVEMFSYTFLVRAFIVGLLVSLCASLLGVSLVLKRYSMIGDGLSHVGFGSLAVATATNMAPLVVSIPVVVAAAFLLLRLSENSKIKGDAAIAMISTGALAVGVVVISQTTGMNTDVCNYLFGSILAMTKNDVYLSVALSVLVLFMFIVFYNIIFSITFDETFVRSCGVNTGFNNMVIALLTAVTIVLGMRMMGALLISSLIIFPALTSMRLCKRFKTVTVCAAVVSVVCYFLGLVISYVRNIPTGASVVILNIFTFLLFSGIRFSGVRVKRRLQAGSPAVGNI
ncbi:MAG: metal ABC transporter permease [Spirochaetaceae bacterium]|nr:metal ABC transporter permease [Spirochaetaceae bacterium]